MKRPSINIRWRSKAEAARVRKAAKLLGLSVNQFVIGRVSNAADRIIAAKELHNDVRQLEQIA
jgi:uncharacterized protein (DUF1778 family)